MKEIRIGKREEGQKLIRLLSHYLPEAGSGFLHKMIRKKNIVLNGKKTEGGVVLKDGDMIRIYFSDETLEHFRGKQKEEKAVPPRQDSLRKEVRKLYENDDIIAFHKPAGMLSQKADASSDSLNDYLLDYCRQKGIIREDSPFRPSVANRLDRNTSGIVLCGISAKGLRDLTRMLKERTLRKYYLALVEGRLKKGGHWIAYLTKDNKSNTVDVKKSPSRGASRIETAFEVLACNDRASLLKVDLITGKSHQIRAHFASCGHPLIGDPKYSGKSRKSDRAFGRQMLHCERVHFMDGEKEISIHDPLPDDFTRALARLGLEKGDGNGNMEFKGSSGQRPRGNDQLQQ